MARQQSLPDGFPFSSRWTKKLSFFPPLRSGQTGTKDNMETFTIHDMLINSTDIYRILCEFAFRNMSECENASELGTPPPTLEPKGKKTAHSLLLGEPVSCYNIILSCVWRNHVHVQQWKRITHPCARSPKLRTSLRCAQSQLIPSDRETLRNL